MTAAHTAQLFHELNQLARSGLPMVRSLEIIGRQPGRISRCARLLASSLQTTGSVGAAFRAARFPESDAAVIEAGEATGRLDQVYGELEEYYTQLAAARRRILAKSLYPIVILHLGVVLLAIPRAVLAGSVGSFWTAVAPVLAVVYLALFLAFLAWRACVRLVAAQAGAARVILAFPVIGGFLADWTAWKFGSVFSLYIRAGGGVLKAVTAAAGGSGNALMRQAGSLAVAAVRDRGASLGEAFRSAGGLPPVLARAIEVGEEAGRLDEESLRAAEELRQRTLRRLETLADWSPKILYFAIVLYTGWQIISMALEVGNSVRETLESATM